MELIVALVGIALVDALNPATIVEASILAASRHPVRAVLSYWCGALTVYFALGLLLSFGPADALADFLADPPAWVSAAQILLGAGLVALGVFLWRRRSHIAVGRHLTEARPRVAFGLGVAATIADIPTAVPYFAAVTLVASADLGSGQELLALLLYNLIYLSPVLGVLVLRLVAAARADRLTGALQRGIERWGTRVLAGACLVFGPVLAWGGVAALG